MPKPKVERLPDGSTCVRLVSSALRKSLALVKSSGVDRVAINSLWGFACDAPLDFLLDCPDIRGVEIVDPGHRDVSVVNKLTWLRYLRLAEGVPRLDLSGFGHLQELNCRWHRSIRMPLVRSRLKAIAFSAYCPESRTFEELASYKNLQTIDLTGGNLLSLEGVQCLPRLKTLILSNCNRLSDLSALARSAVQEVRLTTCRKVANYACLRRNRSIRSLRLSSVLPLADVAFVSGMSALKEFRLVDSKIIDGNLAPLLRLKKVSFEDKRHYSMTRAEVRSRIGDDDE